jgi:NADH-quinone oxidoreductase subunit M
MHTLEIADYGGLVQRMPLYALAFMLFTMANVGLPGTTGFIGEFLPMIGAFQANTWVAFFSAFGLILSAPYALYLYRRIILGVIEKASIATILDLNVREIVMLLPLGLLVVYYGVHPQPIIDASAASIDQLLKGFSQAISVTKTAGL